MREGSDAEVAALQASASGGLGPSELVTVTTRIKYGACCRFLAYEGQAVNVLHVHVNFPRPPPSYFRH